MRHLILATLTLGISILSAEQRSAQSWAVDAFSPYPSPFAKISHALLSSKIDELTPKVSIEVGEKYSYHLSTLRYLGTIKRGQEKFMVATATYIQSSPENSEKIPATSHGFLILLDSEHRIKSYSPTNSPDQLHIINGKLHRVG
jgi:hypothetical protein